jgi:hypothetical protein
MCRCRAEGPRSQPKPKAHSPSMPHDVTDSLSHRPMIPCRMIPCRIAPCASPARWPGGGPGRPWAPREALPHATAWCGRASPARCSACLRGRHAYEARSPGMGTPARKRSAHRAAAGQGQRQAQATGQLSRRADPPRRAASPYHRFHVPSMFHVPGKVQRQELQRRELGGCGGVFGGCNPSATAHSRQWLPSAPPAPAPSPAPRRVSLATQAATASSSRPICWTTRSGRTSRSPNRHVPSPGNLHSDRTAEAAARRASGEQRRPRGRGQLSRCRRHSRRPPRHLSRCLRHSRHVGAWRHGASLTRCRVVAGPRRSWRLRLSLVPPPPRHRHPSPRLRPHCPR